MPPDDFIKIVSANIKTTKVSERIAKIKEHSVPASSQHLVSFPMPKILDRVDIIPNESL